MTQCSDRLATIRSKLAGGEVATDRLDPPRPQDRRDHAPPADVQRAGEDARRVVQPVQQPFGGIAQDIRDVADGGGGAIAVQADRGAVEDEHLVHAQHLPAPGRVAKPGPYRFPHPERENLLRPAVRWRVSSPVMVPLWAIIL